MVGSNKVTPISHLSRTSDENPSLASLGGELEFPRDSSRSSSREANDLDSLGTVGVDDSSYLKLKPFSKLDPTLVRLLKFLDCFGLTVNIDESLKHSKRCAQSTGKTRALRKYLRLSFLLIVGILSAEVVYDVNLRQSKLLVEQKRSTPLLTFVIVAYSWLTLVIPLICDLSLILIGSNLFRFYSRTTATVCNGMFFGKKTFVDRWIYYFTLVFVAFLDVVGQVVLLGVWPESVDPYMRMLLTQETSTASMMLSMALNRTTTSQRNTTIPDDSMVIAPADRGTVLPTSPKIRAYILDSMLGEKYAHSDLGVCIKILCLMIQFIHSYAFLMIIVLFAHHYATAINNINDNLNKYEFRRLLRQLIILRDSSEQISLMISLPFSLITTLVFMRQIALNGVFIQSTMLPYENWAVSLQSFTCTVSIFMVFIYCDGLQSASKQTHRLKTEQTVVFENKGGNQSIYEFLDYLDRLSKSIRITFFNIISINKSSLVGLYGHILTLTFVTS